MTVPLFAEASAYLLVLPLAVADVTVHGLGGFGGVAVVLFAVAALGRAYAAVVTAHAKSRKSSKPCRLCHRPCEGKGRFSDPSRP